MEQPYFTLKEVASGVFAAIANPGEGAMSNAGIIDLGNEVLVVDTFTTPKAARALKAVAEELTNKKVKYVFNTHYHGDHTFGNQVFTDSIIISTPETKELHVEKNKIGDLSTEKNEMAGYLNQLIERLGIEQDLITKQSVTKQLKEMTKVYESIDELRIVPPNFLFEQKLTIEGERRTVELHCHGGGHTLSDAYLYLPEEKIVFAGDLVLDGVHPPIYHSNMFMENLERLSLLAIDQIVPGHGGIVKREQIDTMIGYFRHLHDTVQRASETDIQLSSLKVPFEYSDWHGIDRYQINLSTIQKEGVLQQEKSGVY